VLRAADHPEVARGAPTIERGIGAAIKIGAISKVPPDERVKLRLQELGEALGVVKTADEADGLSALIAGVGVVLGDDQFDVRASGTEVSGDFGDAKSAASSGPRGGCFARGVRRCRGSWVGNLCRYIPGNGGLRQNQA